MSEESAGSSRQQRVTSDDDQATGFPWKTVSAWIGVALAVILVVPLVIFAIAYVAVDVPEPEELSAKQVSYINASDGTTELARIVPPDGNRQALPYDEISKGVQDAVVAAEDREFWTNPGFSITGFGRAVIGQLTGNDSAGGGSTITQQYVKNALVGNDRTITRKARELVYSAKMANEWSKEEVLAAYLNTVYFGRNAYGVQAAAGAYFDKPASELTPEEGAVLAAAIQQPSQLDPWVNREASEERWNYVMDGMVDTGAISPQERAGAVFPDSVDPATNDPYTEADGTNGMIKDRVIAELESLGITEDEVTTRGLKITTTIDPVAQQATVDAVRGNLSSLSDAARSASVSIEPSTGAVRAYYGGEDATGWDYANAGLQTGSTFKIFALAAALQQGIPLSTNYSSAPVTLPGGIPVSNVEGESCGVCSIAQALKHSYNTSFIRLQDDLENTTQDTADMAHALGIARSLPGIPETLTEHGEQPYEGIVLGQYQSRPFDMAIALATLTNDGVWMPPHFVSKIEDGQRNVLFEREIKDAERRVNSDVADNVISAMQPIAAYSRGNALAGGRPSAAKTGTSQLGDTGYNKDAWMIGSTPQLATAVWVGTEDNSPLFSAAGGNMYGSSEPATIWKTVMDAALANQEVESFDEPGLITWGGGGGGTYVAPSAPPVTSQQPVTPNTPVAPAPAPETSAPEQPARPAPQEAPSPEAPPAAPPSLPSDPVEILPGIEVPGELLPDLP